MTSFALEAHCVSRRPHLGIGMQTLCTPERLMTLSSSFIKCQTVPAVVCNQPRPKVVLFFFLRSPVDQVRVSCVDQ